MKRRGRLLLGVMLKCLSLKSNDFPKDLRLLMFLSVAPI